MWQLSTARSVSPTAPPGDGAGGFRRGLPDSAVAPTSDSPVVPFNAPSSTTRLSHPKVDDLVSASFDLGTHGSGLPSSSVIQSIARHRFSETETSSKFASGDRLSSVRAMTRQIRRAIGAGGATRVRRVSAIHVLEDDIVAQNYRLLEPIMLVESGAALVEKPPPSDTHPVWATLGLLLLFIALAMASAPLFDTSIDAETITDHGGLLVKKNASYAKAYVLGNGFYGAFIKAVKSNKTAVSWFPQPAATAFLNFSYTAPSDYAQFGDGPCALLNADPKNPVECILMTGHQARISAYGLCRNGSTEFLAVHYVPGLTTPADVGALVSAGTWIENMQEVVVTGLKAPPTCVDGTKIVAFPKFDDRRLLSGSFQAALRGSGNQFMDTMALPSVVRQRMFYLNGKGDGRVGLTLPNSKVQSFDGIISQEIIGSTIADKLEIQAPFAGSKHVFITLYRIAGAEITLPRLQFTFAVAAQSLALLAFMLALTVRNGAVRSYNLVVQILRLPTFCIISIQLLYVLYYQIFSVAYLATNSSLHDVFAKKVAYVAGVTFILMHQVDVRAAVTLWPKMANNDSYYAARLAWMLGTLAVLMRSLVEYDASHYVVATRPKCALRAQECNVTKLFFTQHWVCVTIFVSHPVAYGVIQLVQWHRNRREYSPRDERHPDYLTSFEAYGCGGPLTAYYYYHTIVTKEIAPRHEPSVSETTAGNFRTFQYLTCAKAVRDEGFVLLGGCNALVRAKDIYIFVLMRLIPRQMAANLNLSVVVAHIVDLRLTPMRRVSYEPLWMVAHRWDGRVWYPDIG